MDQMESGQIVASKKQLENSRILHHKVKEISLAGTPFLHNWLNTLVDGILHQKSFYKAFYFSTPMDTDTNPGRWKDCDFHVDIEEGPHEQNFRIDDKTLVSICFLIGNSSIKLDI